MGSNFSKKSEDKKSKKKKSKIMFAKKGNNTNESTKTIDSTKLTQVEYIEQVVAELIPSATSSFNVQDSDGNTEQHRAILNEDLDEVIALCSTTRTEFDIENNDGFTAVDLLNNNLKFKEKLINQLYENFKNKCIKINNDNQRYNEQILENGGQKCYKNDVDLDFNSFTCSMNNLEKIGEQLDDEKYYQIKKDLGIPLEEEENNDNEFYYQ